MKELNHEHKKNNRPHVNEGQSLNPNHVGEEIKHKRKKEKFSPGEQQDYNPEDFSTD